MTYLIMDVRLAKREAKWRPPLCCSAVMLSSLAA